MISSNGTYKVLVELNRQHYTTDIDWNKPTNIKGTDWMVQLDTMLMEPTYEHSGIAKVKVWFKGHQPIHLIGKITKNFSIPSCAANNPITYKNYTKRLGRRYVTPVSNMPDASMVPDTYFRWTWCCILLEKAVFEKQRKLLENIGWGYVRRLAYGFFKDTKRAVKNPYEEVYIVERSWNTRKRCMLDVANINEALAIIKSNPRRNQNPEGVIICSKQFGLDYKGWSKYGHLLFNTLTDNRNEEV